MQRALTAPSVRPSAAMHSAGFGRNTAVPAAKVRVVGLAVAGTLVVGARDDVFGKVLKIPLAVVLVVAARVVRELVERGGDGEVGALEDDFVP